MLDARLLQHCIGCNKPTLDNCPRCKKPFCSNHDASECIVPLPIASVNGTPGPFVKMGNFPKVVDNHSSI